jgi:hypothetical protein
MAGPLRQAIIEVLTGKSEPMHYLDITEAIAERGSWKTNVATPAKVVGAEITRSIKTEGDSCPYERVSRGVYKLRGKTVPATPDAEESEIDEAGLIQAFGMYWARVNVDWTVPKPKILGLGQYRSISLEVNFYGQHGVYLLLFGRDVVYVGRATDQPLGLRLRQHTTDRLNGRWDRFSWFGVDQVSEQGDISGITPHYERDMLIATMEALLIEGLEPPQNRKRGDDFRAVEFSQIEDPSFEKEQELRMIEKWKKKMLEAP